MQKINKNRVDALLEGLAAFTSTTEGVTRLAYSETDRAAQEWLLDEIKDLHLTIREDAIGNLFLRREGTRPEFPAVATGSHLDSVIHGGAYDGCCGVVGAIEALYMLKDVELKRSIEIVIFRAEESSRFGFATVGSKLLTGAAELSKLNKAPKAGDVTLMEAMETWGCDLEHIQEAQLPAGYYSCFAELHIEQGKVLEETHKQIGLVHNIAAPTRFKLHIKGVADHSGATPMGFRKDALVSAAKMILAIEEAATSEKEHGTVATVGVVEVDPGSINVVPGAVTLWVDVRGVQECSIIRTLADIKENAESVAVLDGVGIRLEPLTEDQPVALSRELSEEAEAICESKGFTYLHMNSGAGHDCMHMTRIAPSTMFFIPCRRGVSHNPAEFARIEDICNGIEVLAEFLQIQANK